MNYLELVDKLMDEVRSDTQRQKELDELAVELHRRAMEFYDLMRTKEEELSKP